MAKSLEQILGSVNLGGLIVGQVTGIPQIVPPGFMAVTREVLGKSVRYLRVKGTRKTSRLVAYGSPALRRRLKDLEEVDVVLLHSFEELPIDPLTLQQLRNYADYGVQQLGMQEVARQAGIFRDYFRNLRIAAVLSVLVNGKIWYNNSGDFLPSATGAVVTVDMRRTVATNEGQGQEMDLATALVSASWATATTDIPKDLRRIHKTARRRTGYPLRYAFYGENVPSYFATNNFVKDWFIRNAQLNQQWMDTGEIPPGSFRLEWIPAYEAFYDSSSPDSDTETISDFWPADMVVLTPAPSVDWWEYVNGSYLVPNSINIQGESFAVADAFRTVYGGFGYSLPSHNPPSYTSYFGDTFLPVLKVPDASYALDVTP